MVYLSLTSFAPDVRSLLAKRGAYSGTLSPMKLSTKLCTSCKKDFPFSLFYRDSSKRDGFTAQCKKCVAISAAKYREGEGKRFTEVPFTTFVQLKGRCNNPKNPAFSNYGGRGIKCLWNNSREFLKDMGSSWKEGLTLDRIDNNGNYCKENCRWASRKVQNNNRRDNIRLTFNGETHTLHEWADKIGMNYHTLHRRVRIKKLPLEIAFAI